MANKGAKKVRIPAKALLLALLLALSFLGLLLFFAYGFDASKQMAFYPIWVMPLPLVIAFPLSLLLDLLVFRSSPLPVYAPNNYRKILWISLAVTVFGMIAGGILLGLSIANLIPSDHSNLPILFSSLVCFPGQIVYLTLCLIDSFRSEGRKNAILLYAMALILVIAGFITGLVCLLNLSFGWGLFFLASPMAEVLVLLAGRDSFAEPLEH